MTIMLNMLRDLTGGHEKYLRDKEKIAAIKQYLVRKRTKSTLAKSRERTDTEVKTRNGAKAIKHERKIYQLIRNDKINGTKK